MEAWSASLADRLLAYGRTAADPAATAVAAEFAAFVREQPDCLWRTCRVGHLTASAWIVDAGRQHVLLTHHRKLDRWLQLGGHVDGDADLAASALREAREESGLAGLAIVSSDIFDLDRHWIPVRDDTRGRIGPASTGPETVRGPEPAHWHYDVRFLLEADPRSPLVVTRESKSLAWIELAKVAELNADESLLRMVRKTR